jgi:hypothetical protein
VGMFISELLEIWVGWRILTQYPTV